MELIDNCKNALDALLDYFTCNLRPDKSQLYNIQDWTGASWKYRKEGKSWVYISRQLEDGTWTSETLFHIRKTTTELYATKDYTLFATAWTNYQRFFRYYILDNSKLIKDGGSD